MRFLLLLIFILGCQSRDDEHSEMGGIEKEPTMKLEEPDKESLAPKLQVTAPQDPSQSTSSQDPSQSTSSQDPSQSTSSQDPSQSTSSQGTSQSTSSQDPSQAGVSQDPSQSTSSQDPSQSTSSQDPSQAAPSQKVPDDTTNQTGVLVDESSRKKMDQAENDEFKTAQVEVKPTKKKKIKLKEIRVFKKEESDLMDLGDKQSSIGKQENQKLVSSRFVKESVNDKEVTKLDEESIRQKLKKENEQRENEARSKLEQSLSNKDSTNDESPVDKIKSQLRDRNRDRSQGIKVPKVTDSNYQYFQVDKSYNVDADTMPISQHKRGYIYLLSKYKSFVYVESNDLLLTLNGKFRVEQIDRHKNSQGDLVPVATFKKVSD